MLFRASVIALALAACLANGTYINTGPSNVPSTNSAVYSKSNTVYKINNTSDYASTKSQAVTQFSTVKASISRCGPIFKKSLEKKDIKAVIKGLGEIHASFIALRTSFYARLGIWVGADLSFFAGLYVDLLVQLQVVLNIIQAHGQINACHSAIVALNAPLREFVSVFSSRGIHISGMVDAKVNANFLASIGVTLDISGGVAAGAGLAARAAVGPGLKAGVGAGAGASIGGGVGAGAGAGASIGGGVGAGAGAGAGVGASVGAGVGGGVGAGASVAGSLNTSTVLGQFTVVGNSIAQCGPRFEDACKQNRPQDLINGLVDIRASILSLSTQLNAGAAIWVGADINSFAQLSVDLLVKLQVVLQIIQNYGQIGTCQSSIAALCTPLQAVFSVCVNAGINITGLIAGRVDLGLLATLGISLQLSANFGLGAGASFPGFVF